MSDERMMTVQERLNISCTVNLADARWLVQQLTAAQATIAQLEAQVAALTTENPECLGHIPDVVAESDHGRCVRCLQPYPCEVRRMWIRWGEENRQLAARDAQVAELTAALAAFQYVNRPDGRMCWCTPPVVAAHYPAHGWTCNQARKVIAGHIG